MKKTSVKKIAFFVALVMFCIVFLSSCEFLRAIFSTEEINRFQPYEKTYSLKEARLLEKADFRSLNSVDYSSMTGSLHVSESYVSAVNAFSERVYRAILAGGVTDGFSFSPLSLYEVLCIAALGSDDETALAALDNLLGMTKETRKNDFISAYKKDFFANDRGTLQIYNAAFLTNAMAPNNNYVQELTDHYVEAFSMNFLSDESVGKLLSWANEKMGEQNFLKKEDLSLRPDTIAYLFSTIYFDNKWSSSFVLSGTTDDTFYGKNGNKTVPFMHHSYYGTVFDYGDYVACYDYYANGLRIKYLVPKEETDDIYELTKNADILSYVPENTESEGPVINLSVPRFSSEYTLDVAETLGNMGLSCLFNRNGHSFNYMFSDLPTPYFTYLTAIKQKNKISFSEDGTIIKSTTYVQLGGAKSAAPHKDGETIDTYDIKLDQPFIYVVYDKNDLPLYVGHVDMP